MKQPAVYILATYRRGTLYIGVTSNLLQRTWQHKNDITDGFSKRYEVHRLVYFEIHSDMREAIQREKQIKAWKREWKFRLIKEQNPEWQDLWPSIIGDEPQDGFLPAQE
jgi:putative endonuclease